MHSATQRHFVLLASVVALALGAAGCGGGDEEGAEPEGARAGGPLTVNIAQAPATLDPAWACGLFDLGIIRQFYVQLTQYGTKEGPDDTTQVDFENIEPYFAESIDISDDGLVYTFKLPSGATFPSGEPVDAAAVKFSLERAITMNGCGAYFIYDGIYEPPQVKSIETPDPTTVVITLNQPNTNFLQDLAQPAASIVDPSVVEANGGVKEGEVNEYMAGHVAGSGPFLLEEYQPNRRAVLNRNPDFFGDPPAEEQIIINWINADSTLLLQARNEQADITIGMSKQSAHELLEDDCCRVVVHEATFWELIGTPWDKPPWDNELVREAVTYAVPYEDICNEIAFGWCTLYYGPYAPAMPEFNEEISQPRQFDMERAKELMEQSGVQTPITVQMNIPEGNTIEEQIATVVQGTWRELGINVQINKLSATDYINSLEQHEAQSFTRIDGPGVVEAGYLLGYDMKCDIGFNLASICVPEADKLLQQARIETDPEERQRLFDEIARIWVEHSPRVQVYADRFVTVLGTDVTHYYYSHEIDMRTWEKG